MNGEDCALLVLEAPGGDLAAGVRALGIPVTECAPQDAFAAVAMRPYDVVVAPTASYRAGLCDAARNADPHVQLLVVSAPERVLDGVALLRTVASDVLVEPLDPGVLARAVGAARRRRDAQARAALAGEAIRGCVPPRLGGTVAHELANRVAVLVSALSAVESALADFRDLDALLASNADVAAIARWWQDDGRDAVAEARDAASEATQVTDRLRSLARDLRAVLRMDPAGRAPFDVAEPVATALRLARPALAPVARIEVDLPPRATASGSAGALARAVLELLLSSADAFAAAGARGGRVRISFRGDPGAAVLVVDDDAPRGQRGALPVSVARDLVERQGGAFAEVRHAAGEGRAFELRLPVDEAGA